MGTHVEVTGSPEVFAVIAPIFGAVAVAALVGLIACIVTLAVLSARGFFRRYAAMVGDSMRWVGVIVKAALIFGIVFCSLFLIVFGIISIAFGQIAASL